MVSLFVVMMPSGLPARTAGPGGGNKPPSAKLYEHAGHARRVVRECHPRGKVLRSFVKADDAVTENDMCIGFCILDADGYPIRAAGRRAPSVGRTGSTCVRLYEHLGFAQKAARAFGAHAISKVFI